MNDEQRQLFSLVRQPPARFTAEQVAWLLNCQAYDIPVLLAARLLKPLGNPQPSSRKYFAAAEITGLMQDRSWLNRVTVTLQDYWQGRNDRRNHSRSGAAEDELSPNPPPPMAAKRRRLASRST